MCGERINTTNQKMADEVLGVKLVKWNADWADETWVIRW